MSGTVERVVAAHRSGACTPAQTVAEAIRRIQRANPALNFLAAERFDQALAEAERMTDLHLPLAGVPVLIKDLEDVAGLPTRKGSRTLSAAPPAAADSTVPARLRAAGAIVVGKTTLPEFAIEGFTANLVDGVTRNPWNTDLSPGGSSGGSAAAVASGCVPLATATDGGGSIRIPAAFCGLVGLKPTNGFIGRWPAPDWIDYSTEGPLATCVADVRTMLSVTAGAVAGDPSRPPLPTETGTPFRRVIAMTRTSDLGEMPRELVSALEQAVSGVAEMLGATVEWRSAGTLFSEGDPDIDWFTVAGVEHLSALGRSFVTAHLNEMHPSSQQFFSDALAVGIEEYLAARRRRFGYIRAMSHLLGDDGVLVTCTNGLPGWRADGSLGSAVTLLPPSAYNTAVFNVTGNPAVALPHGVLSNGLPFGFQVVAPHWRDWDLLDLAAKWEAREPWPQVAPGYEPFAPPL